MQIRLINGCLWDNDYYFKFSRFINAVFFRLIRSIAASKDAASDIQLPSQANQMVAAPPRTLEFVADEAGCETVGCLRANNAISRNHVLSRPVFFEISKCSPVT